MQFKDAAVPLHACTLTQVYKMVVPLGRALIDLGYCDSKLKSVVDDIESESSRIEPRLPSAISKLHAQVAAVLTRPPVMAALVALGAGFALGRRF